MCPSWILLAALHLLSFTLCLLFSKLRDLKLWPAHKKRSTRPMYSYIGQSLRCTLCQFCYCCRFILLDGRTRAGSPTPQSTGSSSTYCLFANRFDCLFALIVLTVISRLSFWLCLRVFALILWHVIWSEIMLASWFYSCLQLTASYESWLAEKIVEQVTV